MLIQDIFAAEVTRDIAPVIYFHEQDPAKVLEEVSEYIITGGYRSLTRDTGASRPGFMSSL